MCVFSIKKTLVDSRIPETNKKKSVKIDFFSLLENRVMNKFRGSSIVTRGSKSHLFLLLDLPMPLLLHK